MMRTTKVKVKSIGSTNRAGAHRPPTSIIATAIIEVKYTAPTKRALKGRISQGHWGRVKSVKKNKPTPAPMRTKTSIIVR
jgi:hypothetical protein